MIHQTPAQSTSRTLPAKQWWRLYSRCCAERDTPRDAAAKQELRRLIDRHARPSITLPHERITIALSDAASRLVDGEGGRQATEEQR